MMINKLCKDCGEKKDLTIISATVANLLRVQIKAGTGSCSYARKG